MINRTIQLEDIASPPPAGGGTCIINCPRGYRYKSVTIKYKRSDAVASAIAHITEVQVRMGGGIQRRATGVQIDAINALNGAAYASQQYGAAAAGNELHLKIYFEEPWRTRIRANSVDNNQLGWKTGWLPSNKSLQIAVTMASMAVAPVMSAEAEISDDDDGQPNSILKWNSDIANYAGQVVSLSNLDNGLKADDRIAQLSCFDPTGATADSAVHRLEVGSIVVKQDQTKRALITELIHAGMSPASATAILAGSHIVFDKNDALDDTLPVGFISSLLKITYAGTLSSGMPYITQVFGAPNRS